MKFNDEVYQYDITKIYKIRWFVVEGTIIVGIKRWVQKMYRDSLSERLKILKILKILFST